jgi:nucleoside-diphosphate-sugar epimerase
MRVLVVGGAGYVGSRLVPELLARNYEVGVLDLYLYGDVFRHLAHHPKLVQIRADIRDLAVLASALQGYHAVIHLACISNDPSFELNPALGKSINLDAFEPLVKIAKQQGVRRFIYASSSSVYGVKEEPNVTEEIALTPLTDYSRFKAECEQILLRHLSPHFIGTVLRPATICGYAPRQRLDLVVNILTNLAYHTGIVKVMGGEQLRPNIHIEDMVRAYLCVLEAPETKIQGAIFNVGDRNYTVMQLGQMVARIVGKKREVRLMVEPTNDPRSYHITSEKIKRELCFEPQNSIEKAIEDLVVAFESGKLPHALSDIRYVNIKTMQAIQLQ